MTPYLLTAFLTGLTLGIVVGVNFMRFQAWKRYITPALIAGAELDRIARRRRYRDLAIPGSAFERDLSASEATLWDVGVEAARDATDWDVAQDTEGVRYEFLGITEREDER